MRYILNVKDADLFRDYGDAMNQTQSDAPGWPEIELGGLTWADSQSRSSYWRDFDGVGRVVITRVRDGTWGFCVRGPGKRMVIPWIAGFQTSWHCAAGCRAEISERYADQGVC